MRLLLLSILTAALVAACAVPAGPPQGMSDALVRLPAGAYPEFAADDDAASLAEAVGLSVLYYSKLPPGREFSFGTAVYTAGGQSASLGALWDFLQAGPSPGEIKAYVERNFDVYVTPGSDGYGTVLFTGYYTPSLSASRIPDSGHLYPLYARPDDLVTAELGLFRDKWKGEDVKGRVDGDRLVPYFSRSEIDAGGALSGRGLEIAWCSDPVDVFFLHVQGSGVLVYEDGCESFANYDGANGREYRSIGRLLIEEGKATRQEMSLQWLKGYLAANPAEVPGVLGYNESYVFFKLEEEGPFGSLGVPVTPERTVATDRRFFPEGALCFITAEVPSFNEAGEPVGLERYSRFVMNQDTGGAIKGAGRADIYFGHGGLAELRAGHMKNFGKMYFLAGKAGAEVPL